MSESAVMETSAVVAHIYMRNSLRVRRIVGCMSAYSETRDVWCIMQSSLSKLFLA